MSIHQKEIFEVWKNIFSATFDTISSNSEVSRVLKSRTSTFDDFTDSVQKALKDNQKLEDINTDTYQTFSEYAYEHQILADVEKYASLSKKARQNSISMSNKFLKLPDQKQQISTALGKLAKHVTLSIESKCLDCWYEHNQLPFSYQVSRIQKLDLISECKLCGGKGVIHKIDVNYPKILEGLLVFDSSWIYEVFIGFALAKLDFIEKIYVHKKIQMYENGEIRPGLEIDVIAVTTDKRLILAEVTKQGDSSNILEVINRKIKNLQAANIPYDKLMYFTSDRQEQFYDVPGNGRVFCLSHLAEVEKFVADYVGPPQPSNA